MIRAVIELEEDEKEFLDRVAMQEGVSVSAIIRRAVREHMRQMESRETDHLLDITFGLRNGDDALSYVNSLRDEW